MDNEASGVFLIRQVSAFRPYLPVEERRLARPTYCFGIDELLYSRVLVIRVWLPLAI